MAFIQVNDANFYYELHGKGQPLILIAGYTCDHLIWGPLVDALSKYFQVLTFDNRGVGQTKDSGDLSAELMAKDVIALAGQLKLAKPHIVGQSMGGTIAQVIASHYPDKISKLCLLTTVAKWRHAMLRGLKSLLELRENNVDFDLIFAATLPWIFGENFLKNENNIVEVKKLFLENPHPQTLADQIRQFTVLEKFDGIKNLKNISAPTLIVHGIQDLLSLPYESELLAKQIPSVSFETLDCAHGIMQEVPQELTELIVKFLH